MVQPSSSSASRYSSSSSPLSLHSPSLSSSASTSDRYLGYSPSVRHDRSHHYFPSNNALDDIAAFSTESPQDAPSSSSSSSIHARHFRGYSAPERERERYRYDSDGRLLEQNQKSSPTASPSSSPTQQQQQQQPHPRAPQHQHQHHQHQFHPYPHQQHQPHNSIHHYPQYSQPSSSMHESSSSSGIQQHRVVGLPMGSHFLPTGGFHNTDPPKKDDNGRRSSVVAQAPVNNNNGRPSMQAHALPPSPSPWERGEHEHEHGREQRASSEVINSNNNNDGGGDPPYRYPIHSPTYLPSISNSNRSNPLPLPLQPSSSSFSSPSSSASSPSSSSSSVSPSSSSPLSSSSSSPTSAAACLASNHLPSETTSAPLPLLTSTSTAGALPLSTATVPWNRSSLRHEIISMESPPPPASSASFNSLHSSSSSRHSNPSHGHTHSHSSSSTTPSPPHPATHSPTTTVMKTPPHPTPDSSSSPETQRRRSRPTIPTTSSTTTPLPPPPVESSSTMVVPSSSQNPSGKVRVGRPPTRREEEEEEEEDGPSETDTGSTFDSGQQKRHGSELTMTEEEDQEVPRTTAAGAMVGRERGGKGGEQSSIMRAQRAIHHASQAASGGAGGDENDYDRDRDENRAAGSPVSPSSFSPSSASFLPSPHTTTSSSHGRINNNNSSNYINNSYNNNNNNINSNNSSIQQQQQQQRRIRPDQPFHDSPPPPPVSPSSKRDLPPQHSSSYPQQQQQQSTDSSSQEYHHQQKRMMGRASGPSLFSSSTSSPPPPPAHLSSSAATLDHPSLSQSSSQPLSSSFSLPTGTQQGAAPPAHGRFSPSMNHTPLSFDQTGHTPNYPPIHSPSGPSLNNKRRSLADLLFVPTKIKAKRSSSSSVSSVDSSYRQDETGQELSGNVNVSWSNHPKSASATSTTSTSSTGSMSGSAGLTITSSSNVPHHHYQQHHHQQQQQQHQQRMSLESQASPPARKSSTVKGVGKGAGSGGLGSSSSPKTFQCTGYPGCNMVFTRSEHLARHERKHTGEKPYKCIVANCPRTFSRYDNMIQHTQTHSDRTKRDSLAAVAVAASAAGVGSGPHSRSSSVQSTPLLPGRPRGGSSPVVFGPSWDENHRRTQNNSPAASLYNASPAFSHHHQQQQQQQHHHPYSPHFQHYPQQQQQPHHPIQWSLPSGAPAGSSPALSAQYYSHHHGTESHPYLPGHQSPSTPVIRTLKANSRSLPHLQARASPIASSSSTAASPFGLQQSMSTMEIEELKRRKSEVLLPSSFSGARVASSTSTGYDQGVGLGMSPFTPATSHPQSLPQVEKLTEGEQERLNEHRRSAQAVFIKMNAGREGFMDTRRTPEYSERSSSTDGHSQQYHHQQPLGINTTPRSGSTGPALPQVQQLSALEKDRLLEHRKSTPELMYDAKMKRTSNDPTDMVVQPLPSRDARSGMQWFSQISTPVISSPRSSLTPREGNGGGGLSSVQGLGHSSFSSSSGPSSGDSSMILPPILGPYEEPQRDRQSRLRSHSSHIHPLSRPLTQFDPSSLAQFPSSEESKDQRRQFDAALSPRLERHWEEQYFPIRKRNAIETIEQMDSRDFLGLKYLVAEHYANEQFRNPEFLGNMTAILCVVRAPHTAWKGDERRQGSQGSVASASEQGSSFAESRRTSRDMEVDEAEQRSMAAAAATKATAIKTEEGASAAKKEFISESMDVDDGSGGGQSVTTSKDVVVQPCRFALDIDVDSFSRDPEPGLRGFESLTINSLFPTRSFVAGFEDTPAESHTNASEKERYLTSHNGYPSNARLGRFYLPERSYRTPESLATQPDPNDRWVCCRFEEYHGVSIWVLESVLDKYHEISRRHKMALTLVGATVHHREVVYNREDWEIHSGEQYEVKVKESVLYPEMIHQVWMDMYHRHHQRAQYQHQQQQCAPPMPQVATYEEYQRSLMQSDPRRDSYQPQQQQQQQQALPRDQTGPYYSYSDYRQQQQYLHREDLSSAPSSPQSPRHDDFPDESPQQHHQQYQQHQRQGSSASASANMHRRISIAELCNPMQSLATERAQRREETASKRTSM